MRLTTRQLLAVLHAVSSVTAGDWDGWTRQEQAALEAAETKLQAAAAARRDYARVNAAVEAEEADMLADPEAHGA